MASLPKATLGPCGSGGTFGVTKGNRAPDAVKAAGIALSSEGAAEPEKTAVSLESNVIRF